MISTFLSGLIFVLLEAVSRRQNWLAFLRGHERCILSKTVAEALANREFCARLPASTANVSLKAKRASEAALSAKEVTAQARHSPEASAHHAPYMPTQKGVP